MEEAVERVMQGDTVVAKVCMKKRCLAKDSEPVTARCALMERACSKKVREPSIGVDGLGTKDDSKF